VSVCQVRHVHHREPFRDDAAVVDHRHPMGETVRLVEVLGGEEHRGSLPRDPAHQLPYLIPAPRVHSGIGRHLTRRRFRQPKGVEQLHGSSPRFAPGESKQPLHQHQVLVSGKVFV